MKVEKLKKLTNGRYKLILDNNQALILYEDVIIKHALLTNKEIDSKLLEAINKDNYDSNAYNQALYYITVRLRSEKEIREYLYKKEYDKKLIENTIDKLIKEGYINDFVFTKAFLDDKINFTYHGPHKIKKELEDYGVANKFINDAFNNIDDSIWKDKIKKSIEKQMKAHTKYTGNILKNKILNYLLNLGYERDMILEYLSDVNMKDNTNLNKEYKRLYDKYSKKYSGYKLEMTIKQKLYQKGYTDINLDNI